jgi:arsenate reductase-like glutaredoxin family protein
MIQPKDIHPVVQEILFRNLAPLDSERSWKAQITNLLENKITPTEFKQFVVDQFVQIEEDITRLIHHLTKNERLTMQLFEDNLKTKALLKVIIEHPEFLETLQLVQEQKSTSVSSVLISAGEVEDG